ncbi:MAG: hypothetical protein A2Y77_13520 [Planctomycetes bacterium RBG_13_62_9]|nr:MAG: hypothetical protein A2Y77_13520 [Planctomycetes bacterium RBG_13_62_9]
MKSMKSVVPHLSFCVFLLCGNCLAAPPSPEALDACMRGWADQNLFSGTVLAAQDGQVLLHNAYGMADYNAPIANTCDTRFRIGSLTKGFTALAVLQLEEQGRLRTSDRLATVMPDYPHADTITLDMLLNHRSGIVDHTTLPDFQTVRRTSPCALARTIETFQSLPLDFTPGTQFKYSNSNYILLGHIIESVTRKPYADVIQRQILEPLGMHGTGFEYYRRPIPNMALDHTLENGSIRRAQDRVMQNAHASGALYSTAHDLYLWDRAFRTGRLVKEKMRQKILSCDAEYRYGWATTEMFDRKILAHSGETEGFCSTIIRFVDDDACLIVLSNLEGCSMGRIIQSLSALLFDRPYQLPKKAPTGPQASADYGAYVGRYQIKPGFFIDVTTQDGQLYRQATGQSRLQLHPESKDTFFVTEADARITFEYGGEGQVARLVLHQGNRDFPGDRL